MIKKLRNFFKDEEGATMVEYGLLVGLISIAAITVLLLIGPELVRLFQAVLDALISAPTPA
jgi:pilus assembly protein Flp/PilA